MKKNILIGLLILIASLGVVAYQTGYLSHKEASKTQEIRFSSLLPNLPPQMDAKDFLKDNPDATQFRMDGETGIDITAPSLSLRRENVGSYFSSCSYIFLKGKLDTFYCVSDMDVINIDRNKYFVDAIKEWGSPNQWVVISVLNTFGPAMVWEDGSSLRVVRGVFEDFQPKVFGVSVSYHEGRKLTDLGKIPEKGDNYEKKLGQVRNAIDRLLQEGNE